MKYGLRTLMVFMVVVAIGAAITGALVNRYAKLDELHRKINALGGVPHLDGFGTILGADFEDTAGLKDYKKISDSDLKLLSEIESMGWLNLSNTVISDAGLSHLHQLPKLELIYLEGTNVTQDGIDKLLERFPACEIYWDKNPY